MKKAVLYARVSSKEQEREGFSIPAQRKYLRSFAAENGLKVVAEFCEAETAKMAGRRKFQEMKQFLENYSDIKDILVEKTDRLYRNFKDYTELDVEEMDLRIHLVKEGEVLSRDSKSHQKFIHGIKVLMAKNTIDNLSEEVRKGQTEKASQGIWPSSAPFGYKNILTPDRSRIIEPDPITAPFVVKAFEMMATGNHSLQSVTNEMFKQGARPKSGRGRISKSAWQAHLNRTLYYGTFNWKGKWYQGKHKPLISKDLFERAQFAMGKRLKPKILKHENAYGGILSCAHCGCSITADHKTKRSGKRYTYYRCTNGKKICSNVVYLREEALDIVFSEALKQIQISPDAIELTRKALLESAKQEQEFHQNALSSLGAQIETIHRRIERCYTDYLDGKITPDEWESRTAAWKAEQGDLKDQIGAHDKADLRYMQEGVKLLELASNAHTLFKNAMSPAQRREMVSLVLSNPRIEDGSVRYDYKMPFAMMVNSTDSENWLGKLDAFRTWCRGLAA